MAPGRAWKRELTVLTDTETTSSPILVLSRSCPPDVGGYQRQFSLLLPRLAEQRRVLALGIVRQPTDSVLGWPGVRTRTVPAYRLPRAIRGVADYWLVAVALTCGLVLRLRTREVCSLFLLSPGMRAAGVLITVWGRWIGAVTLRFPGAGDAARLGDCSDLVRTIGVGPGPAQVAEIRSTGMVSEHIPNAVLPAATTLRDPRIAVVGRLIQTKRVDVTLSAWDRVHIDHADWSLDIVGAGQREPGSVEEELRNQVAQAGTPRVHFHGESASPWDIVGNASVLVIASEREGSPNVVIEAMARGIVVVAPRPAIPDWFRPIPPHIPFEGVAELAAQLDKLMTDPDRLVELSRRSIAFVDEHHSVERISERWTRCFADADRMLLRAGWARVPIDVSMESMVLDVGSGRFPNPRADVLCERFPVRGERLAVVDRPFVVADAEALPFRDDAFQVAIASHLLEHVVDPVKVVGELGRVSQQGYVETPHRRFERLSPEANHLWSVEVSEGMLRMEPNRWSHLVSTPKRRAFSWLYYAGDVREYSTLRLPGKCGSIVRLSGRVVRGLLNRLGITTARYRFGAGSPPRVEVR